MANDSPSQSIVARRVAVRGRVQGVFFRDSVRRLAESRGVAGWARNEFDGSVEVWAEGRPAAVEAVVGFCREGPRRAVVEAVEVEDVAPVGLEGFEVR
jgi:acylphosphatase